MIPDLTLHGLPHGPKQKQIDLRWLLYRDASSIHHRNIAKVVESGRLGKPLLERLELLTAIHRRWQSDVSVKRIGAQTVKGLWLSLRTLVAFSEKENRPLSLNSVLDLYFAYCAYTKRRRDIKQSTKYAYSMNLSQIVAPLLGLDSAKLQWKTRIKYSAKCLSRSAKENLEETAGFVQTLLETVTQLSLEAIRGPLPVTLRYANGGYLTIHCGLPLKPIDSLKVNCSRKRNRAIDARFRRASDTSNEARAPLINLRIDAEMLIFINQTGCNVAQALQLTGSHFRYQSDGDYLRLFVWKNRAKHDVELRIHKAYRVHFDAYLAWRSTIFQDDPDGLTFPFVWNDGDMAMQRTIWAFPEARALMKAIARPFVPPQQLRKTIGNFFRRNLSRAAASELLSNSEQTFRRSYEESNHQGAVSELVAFWNEMQGALMPAAGPGHCEKPEPALRKDAGIGSPKPDCESGGGCLFCDKNRDLRTFDHAWNLASLHHLKLAEFNADRTPYSVKEEHPLVLTIERAFAKLDALRRLGGEFAGWVTEASLRVQEGRYHPFYTESFSLLEPPYDC